VTLVEIFDPVMTWDSAYQLSTKPYNYTFVAHSVQVITKITINNHYGVIKTLFIIIYFFVFRQWKQVLYVLFFFNFISMLQMPIYYDAFGNETLQPGATGVWDLSSYISLLFGYGTVAFSQLFILFYFILFGL
jgi:hypothetical protein